MDAASNGIARCSALIVPVVLIAISVSLGACIQPTAYAQAHDEKEMQGAPPSQEDIQREQDRVAALVDQVAAETSSAQAGETNAPDPPPLPPGPALTAASLEAGIVRLAIELKGPEQTQAEFVGQTLGLTLKPDSAGERTGAEGQLESGHYSVVIWKLYPQMPGQQVSIRVEPATIHTCALDFAQVSGQLEKAGYHGQKWPRFVDPSVSFSKDLGAMKAFIRLDVDSHDTPKCISHVAIDLESKDA